MNIIPNILSFHNDMNIMIMNKMIMKYKIIIMIKPKRIKKNIQNLVSDIFKLEFKFLFKNRIFQKFLQIQINYLLKLRRNGFDTPKPSVTEQIYLLMQWCFSLLSCDSHFNFNRYSKIKIYHFKLKISTFQNSSMFSNHVLAEHLCVTEHSLSIGTLHHALHPS